MFLQMFELLTFSNTGSPSPAISSLHKIYDDLLILRLQCPLHKSNIYIHWLSSLPGQIHSVQTLLSQLLTLYRTEADPEKE